jgi:hypothetical protein
MGDFFGKSRDKPWVSRQNVILKALYEATSSPCRSPLMMRLLTFHLIFKSYHVVSYLFGAPANVAEHHEKVATSK